MKTRTNSIKEQISALKNEESNSNNISPIDNKYNYEPDEEDIYEPFDEMDYEEYYEDEISNKLYGLLEVNGYLEYLVDRYTAAEKNLKALENIIIESIGRDSYKDMMDLIYWQKRWLKIDIYENQEEYNSLNGHSGDNIVTNKVS